ncbi:MAG: hypothetical protein K0S31_1511 [Sphingobacterium multivorum]|nr:hypothetical protein [Sphingobacterium multivorum]
MPWLLVQFFQVFDHGIEALQQLFTFKAHLSETDVPFFIQDQRCRNGGYFQFTAQLFILVVIKWKVKFGIGLRPFIRIVPAISTARIEHNEFHLRVNRIFFVHLMQIRKRGYAGLAPSYPKNQ